MKIEDVSVVGFFTEPFGIGYLEGDPDSIRRLEIENMPLRARTHFPAQYRVWVDECPKDIHDLYVVIAELRNYEFDAPEYDISTLLVATFSRGFPEHPLELLEAALGRLDWKTYATYETID